MGGSKGIQNIIETCKELQKRNYIDIKCSYHLHLGNLPKERVYLVALYMLCYRIQDDIFKMFPFYKLDPRGIKRKNYCQKLEKLGIFSLQSPIKEDYDQFVNTVYHKIFEFLSEGHNGDENINRRTHRHPIDQKWNRHSRYRIYNLINMLFSKSETCEARVHDPTLNSERAVLWLFMNVALVRFCENNLRDIITGKEISFIDVLNFYKNHYEKDKDAAFLSEYLIAYYKNRCENIAKDIARGDKLSSWIIDQDNKFTFSYKGVTLFKN